MECRKCREEIPKGRAFCPNCGLQVDKMDEYVPETHLSMLEHKYDVSHGLYERAFTCFSVGAAALFGTIYAIAATDWIQRPTATFCVSLVFCVLSVVVGILLFDVRDRMAAFRADAPGYLVKLDIIFGVVSTVCFLLAVLLNTEFFGDDLKWWLIGVLGYAAFMVLLVLAEYGYYRDRGQLFNK